MAFIRQPLLLAALSGLLLALSFPGPDIGPLAFVALVPLLVSVKDASPKLALMRGLVTGFIFFAIVLSWIGVFAAGKVGLLGNGAGLLLALVMALFIAVFAAATSWLLRHKSLPLLLKVVAIPSLWVLCEYVRQLGSLGMGWGDLGYTQWRDPMMLKIAPLAGIWGMSWVVVLVNTAISLKSLKVGLAVVGACMVMVGGGILATRDVHPSGAAFGAAALQADIDQDVLWDHGRPADPGYYERTLATFEQMSSSAAVKGDKLCLMAETATPGYPRLDLTLRERMCRIASSNDITLIAGGRDVDPRTGEDENVATLYVPNGALWDLPEYAKQQLVPFGEYVPFVQQLKWMTVLHVADFNDEPGDATQPALDAGGAVGKVGVAICYESTYPRFLRQQMLAGANILTVITDDTWFGHTAAARQHLAMSAIRAAEGHRYLVRSAATGISAIFDPSGAELSKADLFTKATVSGEVTPMNGLTFFTRFGDWWVTLCGLIVAATVLTSLRKTRKK